MANNPLNVLLLESVAESAHQLLVAGATVYESEDPYTGGEVAAQVPINAIICRGKGDVSPQLIDQCPQLKVIARCGVGVDNIDVSYATSKGVKVINTPGLNADTVAEQTMALMLILQRQLYPIITAVKKHNWNARNQYQGDEIRGKTLGILGMGHIGQKVAHLASAFGMKVQYWSRGVKKLQFPTVSLIELFETSDILSIHLPLTPHTHGLVNAELLSHARPHTLLINTGRGAVINEEDLLNALNDGRLGGFAADVMALQPPREDHPLLNLDNVLITPHISSLTKLTYNEMCELAVENTLSALSGDGIDDHYVVNK